MHYVKYVKHTLNAERQFFFFFFCSTLTWSSKRIWFSVSLIFALQNMWGLFICSVDMLNSAFPISSNVLQVLSGVYAGLLSYLCFFQQSSVFIHFFAGWIVYLALEMFY